LYETRACVKKGIKYFGEHLTVYHLYGWAPRAFFSVLNDAVYQKDRDYEAYYFGAKVAKQVFRRPQIGLQQERREDEAN
jgi:hypothetical protein